VRGANSEIILALDASSTNVGYCLAQGERYLNSGVYRPKGEADLRVNAIASWVGGMLQVHDPDLVAIEEPTGSHRNLRTDRLLARVGGNIEGVCVANGVPVRWIHAMKVKATGFSKDTAREAALLVGKGSVGPDEADAIGVWQAALVQLNLTLLGTRNVTRIVPKVTNRD
jgi:Holliday junction resolvasome RuvABC endonuclease subunit